MCRCLHPKPILSRSTGIEPPCMSWRMPAAIHHVSTGTCQAVTVPRSMLSRNSSRRYARKTEKVNIGTYAAGSYAHIAIAELNKQYGLKMEAIHYRGEAPMWTDLAGQTL